MAKKKKKNTNNKQKSKHLVDTSPKDSELFLNFLGVFVTMSSSDLLKMPLPHMCRTTPLIELYPFPC